MNAPALPSPAIVWFREDLRLHDNPALSAAVEPGRPLLCVHVLEESPALRPLGGAARWWLAQSLRALDRSLRGVGGALVVLRGDPGALIPALARAAGAARVVWNRRYGEAERTLDAAVKAALLADGVAAESFNARLLHEPWTVTTKTGSPVKVFTPFWRAAMAKGEPDAPLPAPAAITPAPFPDGHGLKPLSVEDLGLEPTTPDWAGGMRAEWTPGEDGARARLGRFLDQGLAGYDEARNRPDLPSTSKLSPHLRFGEISVRQCWHAARHAHAAGQTRASDADLDTFLKEIGWREFSYHLLFHNPALATTNFNTKFDAFPWRGDDTALKAWRRGLTGYPIVDAGMRELWTTGWMHNRVRMIVGSFLVKHLLIDWRAGEDWFWDTLVDADPASNAASWQWVAGTGADAAPYFRIFNPFGQGEKFDPDGAYVRRWVPELARLPLAGLHQPWTIPPAILAAAGVKLGQTYPRPIVDHDAARARALNALQSMKPVA
jgi:deoxyribodipyrimidine photo-lyase